LVFGEVIVVAGPEHQKHSHTHGSGRILMIFLGFTYIQMVAACGIYCVDAMNCAALADAHSRRLCLRRHFSQCWLGLSVGRQCGMISLLPRGVL